MQEETPTPSKKKKEKEKKKYKETNIPTPAPEKSEDEQTITSDTQSLSEDEQQTDTQSETEIQQVIQLKKPTRQIPNLPEKTPSPILYETPNLDDQSILWWTSPLRDDDVQPRHEYHPNELYWMITKEEKNIMNKKKLWRTATQR